MVEISVVAFQDGHLWVAQCIEHDIAAHADSLPKLPRAFDRALAANLSVNAQFGRSGLDGIDPAPSHFKKMYEQATMDIQPRKTAEKARTHFRVAEAA